MSAPTFVFDFYRFVGTNGSRSTEMVRDFTQASSCIRIVLIEIGPISCWLNHKPIPHVPATDNNSHYRRGSL